MRVPVWGGLNENQVKKSRRQHRSRFQIYWDCWGSQPMLVSGSAHQVLVRTTPNRCVRWISRPQLALGQQWYACGAMQWPTARPDPIIIQRDQIRVLCSVPRASRLAGWGALVLLDMRTTVILKQVGVGESNARTCLGWFLLKQLPNHNHHPYHKPTKTMEPTGLATPLCIYAACSATQRSWRPQ